jgi:hypothetical protein
MRSLLVLALLARSAFAAPPASAAPVAPVAPVAPAAPAGRCVIEPLPAARSAPAAAAACHRPSAATTTAIRAAIAKRYVATYDRGKPEVAFGCDGLGPRIRELVIETGGGHGGSLALWHARRGTGTRYDVRGILYRDASATRAATSPPFQLASGRADLPDLDLVRTSLAAKVREVAPPPPPPSSSGTIGIHRTSSSSSRDFHILVRLVDDDGRILERRYTGYEGSSAQDRYLGLALALDALAQITALTPSAVAPTPDDRRLFTDRFAAAVPHFDDDFYWWVMERYIDLARHLGTPATIPGLLTRLTFAKPDRSKLDARADALDALARITGWDARPGASPEAAAARYLAACKPQ